MNETFWSAHSVRSGFLCSAVLDLMANGRNMQTQELSHFSTAIIGQWAAYGPSKGEAQRSYIRQGLTELVVSTRLVLGPDHALTKDSPLIDQWISDKFGVDQVLNKSALSTKRFHRLEDKDGLFEDHFSAKNKTNVLVRKIKEMHKSINDIAPDKPMSLNMTRRLEGWQVKLLREACTFLKVRNASMPAKANAERLLELLVDTDAFKERDEDPLAHPYALEDKIIAHLRPFAKRNIWNKK